MNMLDKAKELVSQNPLVAIIIIVVLVIIVVANYFNFNPWKRPTKITKKEDEPTDEIDKLVDSINSKQEVKN